MRRLFLATATATVLAAPLAAQAAGSKPAKIPDPKPAESPLAKAAAALPFRSIGPGVMSGYNKVIVYVVPEVKNLTDVFAFTG